MGRHRKKKPGKRDPIARLLQKKMFRQRRKEDKRRKLLDFWIKADAKGRGLFDG